MDCLGGARFECAGTPKICAQFPTPSMKAFNETCGEWPDDCGDCLACLAPHSRLRVDRVCVNNVTVGAPCDYEYCQCASRLCTEEGVCTAKVPPGGACKVDLECSTDHYCWRGEGATGQTCRRWVGLNQRCDNKASKCWRQLTCADGLCKNATL